MLQDLLNKYLYSYKRKTVFIAGFCVVLYFVLDLLLPLPLYKINKDYSTVFTDRDGNLLRISLSDSEKYRIKLPLSSMSQYIRKGIIEYEDKYFYCHFGLNPVSVVRAFYQNLASKRIISGASTISMQIARMIERKPRTYWSKIAELFRTIQLELKYSKDELLEIYLNTIPMGGNIEGVGAAAYYYFGKNAKDLSLFESIILIGIPNSPNRNRPDRHPENADLQFKKVLSRIYENIDVSADEYRQALNTNISIKPNRYPFRCPHLIDYHKRNDKFLQEFTIDPDLQSYCENTLYTYTKDNINQDIFNGAVVIVDNKSREVLAYVGSPDYFDDEHCGQINGASIIRSPGSALKPFLYASAIEAGIVTPGKIVYDIPIMDYSYSPANFSKSSLGLVTAEYALTHSLNIPAVRLERLLENNGLRAFLKEVFPLKQDLLIDGSGLSLVLGGYHLSLEQMSGLYMMLAAGGIYRPLKFFMDERDTSSSEKRLFKESTCYIVSEMLTQCHRPDLPYSWEFSVDHPKAALKTGTSFGLKDAVCFGYNPDYTVGVWQGNSDNKGSSHLIGVKRAAPLMIKIFNYISRGSDSWFKRPEDVSKREACSVSGYKTGPLCKGGIKNDFYIPGVSSEKVCTVHKEIFIRKQDNVTVCPDCMSGDHSKYKKSVIEYQPKDVVSFLRKSGRKYSQVPEHNPECKYFYKKDKPKIISPGPGAEFVIDNYVPVKSQKIPLRAYVANDASDKIFWFLGRQLIHEGNAGETFFMAPQRGKWIISAIDSRGRSDSVTISIY